MIEETKHPKVSPTGDGVWAVVGFHDGYITGVRAIERRFVLFWLVTLQGKKYELVLPGVSMLLVSGFQGSNIINSILLYESRACPRRLVAKLWGLDSPQWETVLDRKYDEFRTGRFAMLELGTSDGCLVLADTDGGPEALQIRVGNQ
jgi:hypothetical protein